MHQIKLLLLLASVLLSACGNHIFDLSETDNDPLTRNNDNLVYKSGRTFRYSLSYFDSDAAEKGLMMNQQYLLYDDAYPVTGLDSTSADYQNRLRYVDVLVEEATSDNVTNQGQSTIMYQYYTAANMLIPFASQTSVVDNKHNVWVHPPRNSALKVLNMSAYPFARFPLEVGKKWEYTIPIGRMWGHAGFGRAWEKEDLLFTHSYEVMEKVKLNIGNEALECYRIQAKTESALGGLPASSTTTILMALSP